MIPSAEKNQSLIRGGCHCRAVRFEARLSLPNTAYRCNCSICEACGFHHVIVPARDFTLLQGQDDVQEYRFGSGLAQHLFCRHCGIKAYYVPRSNPDGFSLNLHCLDDWQSLPIGIEDFDGRHWEDHAARLRELSQ